MDAALLITVIGAVTLDGAAGLAGGLIPIRFMHKHLGWLLAYAAGTLIGAAFFDLLPEAFESPFPSWQIGACCLAGFFGFHLLQSWLGGHAAGQAGHKHSHAGPMILVGDAIHNLTDGAAIAVAFAVDFQTGCATALAVIVHELPQEIGDYAILLAQGYSRTRALFLLVLVQCSALIGALAAMAAAAATETTIPVLLAVSAGGFVYIAAADLLPELRRRKSGGSLGTKLWAFAAGLGSILAVEFLLKHHA